MFLLFSVEASCLEHMFLCFFIFFFLNFKDGCIGVVGVTRFNGCCSLLVLSLLMLHKICFVAGI